MHGVLRDRLWRKLEALPEERLYQVLDYVEFLESRYASRPAPPPGGVQRFAERLEDGMRVRKVAPKVIMGTMRVMGAAAKVMDGVTATGRELLRPPPPRTVASTPRSLGDGGGASPSAPEAGRDEPQPPTTRGDGEVER